MQLRFTTTGAKTSMNTIFDCSRVKGDKEPKLDLSARLHLTRGCADFSMEKICYADKASSTQTKKCATKLDIIPIICIGDLSLFSPLKRIVCPTIQE